MRDRETPQQSLERTVQQQVRRLNAAWEDLDADSAALSANRGTAANWSAAANWGPAANWTR